MQSDSRWAETFTFVRVINDDPENLVLFLGQFHFTHSLRVRVSSAAFSIAIDVAYGGIVNEKPGIAPPGIARIIGDRRILDGTTIQEYHLETLKFALEATNDQWHALQRKRRLQAKREEEERRRFREMFYKEVGEIRFYYEGE